MNVINVAVTLGSKKTRRAERYRELEKACGYLGFGLMPAAPGGLENISLTAREKDAVAWTQAVKIIADILVKAAPRAIFLPHEQDWHETHVGTHCLVMDALKSLPADFTCQIVETEFWGAMATPNLMVESSEPDVADLVTALSFHVGEVRRNPYHLLLPAWMQDNVRRGGELVGGKAGAAPDFVFATLYRLRRWNDGRLEENKVAGRQLSLQTKSARIIHVNRSGPNSPISLPSELPKYTPGLKANTADLFAVNRILSGHNMQRTERVGNVTIVNDHDNLRGESDKIPMRHGEFSPV